MVVEGSGTEQVSATTIRNKHFLGDRNSDLLVCFESVKFIQMTAYLADIFHHLNELNLSLQGKGMNIGKSVRETEIFHRQTASLESPALGSQPDKLPFS